MADQSSLPSFLFNHLIQRRVETDGQSIRPGFVMSLSSPVRKEQRLRPQPGFHKSVSFMNSRALRVDDKKDFCWAAPSQIAFSIIGL